MASHRRPPVGAPSLWRLPAVRRLVVMVSLGFSSFFLTLASLPTWAVQGGTEEGVAGSVTMAMMLATVTTQMAVPWLVARFGLAQVLRVGLILLGAPAPLLVASQDLGWLLAVSAVRGCGFAALTVLGASLAAQVVPPDRHGESLGIYGLAISVPNLVAVPAGAGLALAHHFVWVAVLAAAPVLAVPVVGGLAAAVSGQGGRAQTIRSRAAVLAALPTSAVLLVITLIAGGVVTFLPIERPDGQVATLALLGLGVTGALGRWRAGVLADRFGSRLLLPGSLVLAAVSLAGMAAALAAGHGRVAELLVIVAATVFGLGYGAVLNLSLLVAYARTDRDGTTTVSALWNAAFDLGTALGAVIVGAIAAAGPGLAMTLAWCALVVALTLPPALAATGGPWVTPGAGPRP